MSRLQRGDCYRLSMDDDDFDSAWSSAQARLSQIKRELPAYPGRPLRIARVTQADAQLLDNELEHILLEPVTKALQMLRVRFILACAVVG